MLLTLGLGAATMALNDLAPKIFGGYPEVANEQSKFGILKTHDNREEEEEACIESTKKMILTVTNLPVLPTHTTDIMTYITHIQLSNI